MAPRCILPVAVRGSVSVMSGAVVLTLAAINLTDHLLHPPWWIRTLEGAGLLAWARLDGLTWSQLGLRPYVVRTGSMSPTIQPGDAVLAVATQTHPRPGEVITFRLPADGFVTHRVHAVARAEQPGSEHHPSLVSHSRGAAWTGNFRRARRGAATRRPADSQLTAAASRAPGARRDRAPPRPRAGRGSSAS